MSAQKNIVKNAFVNAGATAVYIILIASFFTHAKNIFGANGDNTTVIPIVMLLLLVISAAITGLAVFGRPVMWYLDGKKKEALRLVGYTIAFLALIALVFIVVLL